MTDVRDMSNKELRNQMIQYWMRIDPHRDGPAALDEVFRRLMVEEDVSDWLAERCASLRNGEHPRFDAETFMRHAREEVDDG